MGAAPGEMGHELSLKGRGCRWAKEDESGSRVTPLLTSHLLRHRFPYGTWFLEGCIRSINTLFYDLD